MKYNTILPVIFSLLFACRSTEKPKLPILGSREPVEKIVDGKTVIDTVYHKIPQFNFINQDSLPLSDKDFAGTIYVADFFFTSCPSICPTMHRNMLKVYRKFKDNNDLKILSHTIDTKYDVPSRLKRYSAKLGVTGNKWQFVTGERDSIYAIAKNHYLSAVGEDKKAPGGFMHQGWFVLVDKEKRIRGAYDGTNYEEVTKLLGDIEILLDEYKK